jgi:hypothetical protein
VQLDIGVEHVNEHVNDRSYAVARR